MKLSLKHIFAVAALLIGMLVYFDMLFQKTASSSLIELSATNDATVDSIDLDFVEGEQVAFLITFLFVKEQFNVHHHYHIFASAGQPFFSVWQPPKLV